MDEIPDRAFLRATKRKRVRLPKLRPSKRDANMLQIHVSDHERVRMEQAAARAGYTVETWLLRIALKETGMEP